MRRSLLLLAVVCLAGCSSLSGGPAVDAATPTVTPAPVPETEGVTGLPPGLTGAGAVDARALAGAHVRAAAGTSYVWTDSERRTYAGGGTVVPFARRIVLVDGLTYHRTLDPRPMFVRADDRRPVDAERFGDGRRRYQLPRRGSVPEDVRVGPGEDVARRLAGVSGRSVAIYLDVPSATVSAAREDGRRRYRVEAARDRLALDVPLTGEVFDYRVTATVTPAGFVTRLNATYRTEPGGNGTRVRYGYRFRDVGTATLRTPSWVEAARRSASTNATAAGSRVPTRAPASDR